MPAALTTHAAPVKNCPGVRKALRFYTGRWQHWLSLRGQAERPLARGVGCPRYLLKVRKAKAVAAHRAWNRYFIYHWAWSEWLPDKYARVGACETGYGKRPGSWSWDSGTYISAFGIYRPAYAQFASAIGVPQWHIRHTPRDQYRVAAAIQARFGWGAWGCGDA